MELAQLVRGQVVTFGHLPLWQAIPAHLSETDNTGFSKTGKSKFLYASREIRLGGNTT